jgi:hypothetical protein
MSLWGTKDQANNAPKYAVAGGLGVAANGEALFGNTQVGAFVADAALGVFGVDTTEAGVAGEGKKVAHAGWNLRKVGTGSVISIQIANAGANYKTPGFITFTGGSGTGANASYTVNTTTNTINSVTLVSGGSDYIAAPTANAANATGVNSASFVVTVGGRAGRVSYETLVAAGSITGDAEDTIFPDA